MNLLFTLTAYPPYIGGAQLHLHLLAQKLQANHTIQAVTFWNHNRTDWLLGTTLNAHSCSYNYTIEGISVNRLGLSWVDKLRLAPWLTLYYPLMTVALPPIAQVISEKLEPLVETSDLIHNVRIGREGLTYASLQVARRRAIPFIFTPVHHPCWVGWRYQEYLKLYRQADALIALTPVEANILASLRVPESRIHVTGHGPVLAPHADPIAFQTAHRLASPIVLFLGQHYPYKGYRQVLEAAPRVWRIVPELNFVFAGPTVRQSERVFKHYSDPRIHRLGTVDLQTKTDVLAACDLLCVPSSQESFGGVYTEAWSFGKPVIGGKAPAIADVIADGEDGFLVSQDPAEIADRIIYLLDHPLEAASMGRAGKAKVEANYTWPQIAEKTMRVYEQVCR